jgi:hypothetical protein
MTQQQIDFATMMLQVGGSVLILSLTLFAISEIRKYRKNRNDFSRNWRKKDQVPPLLFLIPWPKLMIFLFGIAVVVWVIFSVKDFAEKMSQDDDNLFNSDHDDEF